MMVAAAAARGANDDMTPRRPRTTVVSCCTRSCAKPSNRRHWCPSVDGDGDGATAAATKPPRAFRADGADDGPVVVDAVAEDGDDGDDGNRRPRADDRTPSTIQLRWPVAVRRRCTGQACLRDRDDDMTKPVVCCTRSPRDRSLYVFAAIFVYRLFSRCRNPHNIII